MNRLFTACLLILSSGVCSQTILTTPNSSGASPRDSELAPFANQCFESVKPGRSWVLYFSEFGEVYIDHVRKGNGRRKTSFSDQVDMNWRWNNQSGRVVADGRIYNMAGAALVGVGWIETNWRWMYRDGAFEGLVRAGDMKKCDCLVYE